MFTKILLMVLIMANDTNVYIVQVIEPSLLTAKMTFHTWVEFRGTERALSFSNFQDEGGLW